MPRVSVHVYDTRAALQLHLSALAQVHVGNAVACAAWGANAAANRACYAISPAPGTEVPAPPPVPSDSRAGFGNFAVLALTVDVLEWLWLHHAGHHHARFAWPAGRSLQSALVVP
jgi:3-hydroxyisobutyrate dehydrogenase